MDVTFPEWGEHLTKLSHEVVVRWPALAVSVDKAQSLRVEIREVMSGAVDLRISSRDDDCMMPLVGVSGSGGLPADPSIAQAKMNEMQLVLDALHYCNARCQGIRVFLEGNCPCAQCSGRGTKYKSDAPCEACDGKGRR
jgi:hypothetical protein